LREISGFFESQFSAVSFFNLVYLLFSFKYHAEILIQHQS
jgi:hypothetical protein